MWARLGIGECSRAITTFEELTLTARARGLGETLAARGRRDGNRHCGGKPHDPLRRLAPSLRRAPLPSVGETFAA
eukprot:2127174-Lingulodinium_polyedra.AAC.1